MGSQKSLVTKYQARAFADECDFDVLFDFQIANAVFRPDEISFDWVADNVATESTYLTTRDGLNYTGRSTILDGVGEATVEAALYTNPNGHVLVGEYRYTDGTISAAVVQFFGAIGLSSDEEKGKTAKNRGQSPRNRKRKG